MDKLREELEKTRLEKMLGKEYVAEMEKLSKRELEEKLLALAKHAEEITTTRNRDDALIQAKDKVRELAAPYREQARFAKIRARFVALLIEEKY